MPAKIIAQKRQGKNLIRWEVQPDGTIDRVLYKFDGKVLKELDRKKSVPRPYNPAVPYGPVGRVSAVKRAAYKLQSGNTM